MVRQILDFFIYFAQHMVLAFVAFFVLWVLLERWGLVQRTLGKLDFRSRRQLVVGFSLTVLTIFLFVGAWYLTVDGFADEVEPMVSSLSWVVQNGQPLYHDSTSAQRYSVLYGPSVFLTNGLFLQILGPSLFTAKLASVLGVLGCLIFLYAALARSSRDWVALMATSLAALYFWSQGFAAYLVRPDSLLLFSVGLGLFAAAKVRRVGALVTVAVMLGFAVNLKVHAGCYFLPVLAILGRRFGWRAMLMTGAGSVFVILAPFAFHPQVSLVNYLEWLRNAMDHGLGTESLAITLRFTAYLALPLAALLLVSPIRAQYLKRHTVELASLVPAYGVALVMAAKPGAGAVHLLPLVPTTMYFVGLFLREFVDLQHWLPASSPRGFRSAALAAVFLTAVLAGSVNAYRSVRLVDWQIDQAPNLAMDVREIMEQYPGVSIGMACGGEMANFRYTWLRPLLIFANNPLLVDPVSVMDSQLTGRKIPPDTYQALENGLVTMWLVPRNQQPFAKLNWYAPHDPVFSDRFIKYFENRYSRRGHSRYFDLWFWNGTEQTGKVPYLLMGSGPERDELMEH